MAEHSQSSDEHDSDGLLENSQSEHSQGHEDDRVTVDSEKRWPGWPGESVFRMLVPAQKVGSIIGRKGEFIKKLCEETRARIRIIDGPLGTAEHAVMISAREEPDASLPPAVDGLLRVHRCIVDGLDGDSSSQAPLGVMGLVSTVLLVADFQAGRIIGKQGATVKSIQEASSCIVRVIDNPPSFALEDDKAVEVVGEPAGVHKAIELISSHLRKFLVDRSVIPLFEMQMQMRYPSQTEEQMHSPPSRGPPPRAFRPNVVGGPGYGYETNPQYMPPARQVDHYYPPVGMQQLPHEKQPHQGISSYGREAPINVNASLNARRAPSIITQVTQKMQIPISYADAVIGTSGASISYTRRASGATVTIQETMGVPGEMTVEINGTVSQVQTAQQLIQHFTEAAGPVKNQTGAATDQSYNPYASAQGSIFASPPYSAAWQTGQNGAYGAVYGGNYGY